MPRGLGYSQASEPKKACLPNVPSFLRSRCSLRRTALWADKHVPIRLGTAPEIGSRRVRYWAWTAAYAGLAGQLV